MAFPPVGWPVTFQLLPDNEARPPSTSPPSAQRSCRPPSGRHVTDEMSATPSVDAGTSPASP
jgi:hypothetical protein